MSLFFQFFGGVPMNETDTFPLVPLGCWLFPIGIYLFIMSFRFVRADKNKRFVIVRYRWVQKWWRHYFLRNLLDGLFTAVCLLALFRAIDLLALQKFTGNLKEISTISALWTVHAMTLSAIFLWLEILKIQKLIPAVMLLLEGLTFLGGFRFRKIARFMFGVWGMYAQSNLYEGMYGFSIMGIMIAQGAVVTACYLSGGYLLKDREMEGV